MTVGLDHVQLGVKARTFSPLTVTLGLGALGAAAFVLYDYLT